MKLFVFYIRYQKAWKYYVKFRHLLANKPKVTIQDKQKLHQQEMDLQVKKIPHIVHFDFFLNFW